MIRAVALLLLADSVLGDVRGPLVPATVAFAPFASSPLLSLCRHAVC